MGKELPLARSEEEGQSMLLADTGSGEIVTVPSTRNKRAQVSSASRGRKGRAVEGVEAKSKGSRKAERANASSSEQERRGRDYQDRKSDRGDEGAHKSTRRSASELGIVFPGCYCDELETVPHHWVEIEKVASGSLFQCKFCHDYLWLPQNWTTNERLTYLIKFYGKDEGYCRCLNKHRPAKILMAKLQYLRRLELDVTNKRKFAKLVDEVMSDKEYDRKEVSNG